MDCVHGQPGTHSYSHLLSYRYRFADIHSFDHRYFHIHLHRYEHTHRDAHSHAIPDTHSAYEHKATKRLSSVSTVWYTNDESSATHESTAYDPTDRSSATY